MDLKIEDVAELLQVSEKTIKRWLDDGKIPSYKINDQFRFSLMEIENWMMNWQQGHSDENFVPTAADQIFSPLAEPLTGQRGGLQQFSLYRAIHKGGVFSNIEGTGKEEIIPATMKALEQRLGMDAEVLTDLLLDREELMPTALNNGVAVPHTRDFLLPGPFDVVAIVFPETPIEYGALDGLPVHTLFFLFSSCDKRHLHLLAKLSHFSSSPEALDFLQTKPSKEALLEYIRIWESNLSHPK